MNEQTIKGQWKQIQGKVKEKWSDLTDDELGRTKGNMDQLIGLIQRKTGEGRAKIQSSLEELSGEGSSMMNRFAETAQDYAGSTMEAVQGAAEQVYDTARAGFEETHRMVKGSPLESIAITFGVGIVAGILIGLAIRSRS